MYLSVHPSIHPSIQLCIYIYIYVCMYVCMYVCISCIYIYIHICVYIYIYIYTLCLHHLRHWCPVRSPSKMLQSPCGTGSQPNLLAMMLFLGTWCRADSSWTNDEKRVPLWGMQRDTNINWKHAVTRFTQTFVFFNERYEILGGVCFMLHHVYMFVLQPTHMRSWFNPAYICIYIYNYIYIYASPENLGCCISGVSRFMVWKIMKGNDMLQCGAPKR